MRIAKNALSFLCLAFSFYPLKKHSKLEKLEVSMRRFLNLQTFFKANVFILMLWKCRGCRYSWNTLRIQCHVHLPKDVREEETKMPSFIISIQLLVFFLEWSLYFDVICLHTAFAFWSVGSTFSLWPKVSGNISQRRRKTMIL